MSLEYVMDHAEKSGGKKMVIARCSCGREFPIRKERMKYQPSCKDCSPKGAQGNNMETNINGFKIRASTGGSSRGWVGALDELVRMQKYHAHYCPKPINDYDKGYAKALQECLELFGHKISPEHKLMVNTDAQ